MMGILEAIKKGFGVASKNLALIIVLFIFNLIWNIVNIALLPAGALPTIRTAAATPPAISPQVSLTVFAFSLLFILVSIFMQGGSLGMVRDYIKGGKVKLAQFASYGLKYYLRLLGLGLLIILLVLIAAIIAAAIGLAGIYFVVLLVMSPYSLICEEVGVIEAMKRSMRAVKKVFWRVVLLLLLLILIAVGIGFLLGILTGFLTLVISARAGQIVISVVNSLFNGYFGIVMMAAFITFYFTLAGKEKVV